MVRRNEVVVLGGVSAGNHDFLYRGIIERLRLKFAVCRIVYCKHMFVRGKISIEKCGEIRLTQVRREGEKTEQTIAAAATGGRGKVYLKEHKYTEWVKYSVPIGEREAVHVDAQPDMENCANGIAPQPNATADGVRRMKVPVLTV